MNKQRDLNNDAPTGMSKKMNMNRLMCLRASMLLEGQARKKFLERCYKKYNIAVDKIKAKKSGKKIKKVSSRSSNSFRLPSDLIVIERNIPRYNKTKLIQTIRTRRQELERDINDNRTSTTRQARREVLPSGRLETQAQANQRQREEQRQQPQQQQRRVSFRDTPQATATSGGVVNRERAIRNRFDRENREQVRATQAKRRIVGGRMETQEQANARDSRREQRIIDGEAEREREETDIAIRRSRALEVQEQNERRETQRLYNQMVSELQEDNITQREINVIGAIADRVEKLDEIEDAEMRERVMNTYTAFMDAFDNLDEEKDELEELQEETQDDLDEINDDIDKIELTEEERREKRQQEIIRKEKEKQKQRDNDMKEMRERQRQRLIAKDEKDERTQMSKEDINRAETQNQRLIRKRDETEEEEKEDLSEDQKRNRAWEKAKQRNKDKREKASEKIERRDMGKEDKKIKISERGREKIEREEMNLEDNDNEEQIFNRRMRGAVKLKSLNDRDRLKLERLKKERNDKLDDLDDTTESLKLTRENIQALQDQFERTENRLRGSLRADGYAIGSAGSIPSSRTSEAPFLMPTSVETFERPFGLGTGGQINQPSTQSTQSTDPSDY